MNCSRSACKWRRTKNEQRRGGRLPRMREPGYCLRWLVVAAEAAGNLDDSSSKHGGCAVWSCCAGRWFFSSWKCAFFFLLCFYSSSFSLSLLFSLFFFWFLFLIPLCFGFFISSFSRQLPRVLLVSPLFVSVSIIFSSPFPSAFSSVSRFLFLYIYICSSLFSFSQYHYVFPFFLSVSLIFVFFNPPSIRPPLISFFFPPIYRRPGDREELPCLCPILETR